MQHTVTAKKLLETVARFGFSQFMATSDYVEQITQLLRRHQLAISETTLQMKCGAEARPNTLSAKHGTAAFPFHTDFAFCAIPPRYILLLNPTDSQFERPTLVARMENLAPQLQSLVRNSKWLLKRFRKHYFVSGQFRQNEQLIWRWDCDFLIPANSEAEEALCAVPVAMNSLAEPINWGPRRGVLIDNWSCAHARGEEKFKDEAELSRTLTRYEFWSNARMVH